MCILSYLPPHTPVDVDGLFNGGLHNPDGHGWAIVAGESIISGRALDLADALDAFATARERYPDGPALFHSRWATHGSVRLDNVHPFCVGGSQLTVVAHNGILPTAAHPARGDDRSDTRVFADEILPHQFRRLDKAGVQRALSQWCGKGNKLVILTTDPRYRRSAYLVNESAGQWDTETGIWHSNGDYIAAPKWPATIGHTALLEDYYDCCAVCGDGRIDDRDGYCVGCQSCQDCMEHRRDCMCWSRTYVAMQEWGRLAR
ncbi:glucosamine 6-phosphate synthetase, contains amidotransferase and phosphosugar isomerase domains [Mycolicibacterium fortuitum subsp. acetamidolyticum]|uniref:Glucosamine 6-phosphate synthetase, contains amidotransferase and phosphosugar isomerase domains n=1 Tax=Mycolicibacterium fortuitum subsp. acetamidolyticum TaxID=144550 RepID=A0A100WW08_MYCFO|nr:glucosamine 6-phosphate synthetase [Mycolicibacterium fortuitum]MCV7137753.1 glucosamine 6-phosphate synthetase [Mycolicibacterium fortuitum]MDV7288473.1 glucosamine 6-phosphate synthetase [Mycolicibacterium fortuitum]MDV7317168.1 glucosamine 6-phosphate synthetase [Mycolicibacterium fortuitum]GAT05413.1 glucosamine 6-phosphate synthetase, contains amidotransferase and phosphosugar isomerase domains [Mycolicibacterium fortuitum subsp. acetamidolyticum]